MLAAVGGFEHAALAGFLLGAAALRTPVVLDGVIAGAAALVAAALHPDAPVAWVAGHRSAEPGHAVALQALGLRPLVALDLRLGEGTGALLALPLGAVRGAGAGRGRDLRRGRGHREVTPPRRSTSLAVCLLHWPGRAGEASLRPVKSRVGAVKSTVRAVMWTGGAA